MSRVVSTNTIDVEHSLLPAQSAEIYTRYSIHPGTKSIRLLHLLPGEGLPIKCTLSVVSLEQQDEAFEALSYAWGDKEAASAIEIDGLRHSVAAKLHIALVNLRYPDQRNDQVRIMGAIYSCAIRVLVWLDEETKQSRAAFDLLTKAYLAGPDALLHLIDEEGWRAVQDLYEREYWSRVWIVQEVCMAREAVQVCGRMQIPWGYLSAMRKDGSHKLGFVISLMARLDGVRDMCRTKGCKLWTLLEDFQRSRCDIIHDKIYGFLGLCCDFQSHELPVDYSMSVQQLFEKVVWCHYRKFQVDKSSPNSAQLMTFAEFLKRYLRSHAACKDSLDASTRISTRGNNVQFATSTSALFRVEHGEPFHHKSQPSRRLFWLDQGVQDDTAVVAVSSSKSYLSLESDIKNFEYALNRPEETGEPTAVVISHGFHGDYSGDFQVAAFVPSGIEVGDLVCIFIRSHIALAFRRVGRDEYVLRGRAALDFAAVWQHLWLKGRLSGEKTVELLSSGKRDERITPWPATVYLDLVDLQLVTDRNVRATWPPEAAQAVGDAAKKWLGIDAG